MIDEAARDELVAIATKIRNSAKLPAGYNAVIVVTDENGAWCGVSSTSDPDYTKKLLNSALLGADCETHAEPVIVVECE